jgi:hypothetical protein
LGREGGLGDGAPRQLTAVSKAALDRHDASVRGLDQSCVIGLGLVSVKPGEPG